MEWIKEGRIFQPDGNSEWWKSHAMAPSAILLDEKIIRVFVGALDENGISRLAYVDIDANDPKKVINVCDKPILDIGEPGTFDENGVFPASIYRYEDKIYFYYTGFQLGQKVRYFMFGGLAISEDNGKTFTRASQAPVTDRADEGMCFRGGPSVIFDNGKFKAYYSSGTEWVKVGGKPRPTYDIYCCESEDGISFPKKGKLCLKYDRQTEHGLGRPQIMKDEDKYRLFYTRRTTDMKYWSGYAESDDGFNWVRNDKLVEIPHSKDGFDSEMVYFPNVIKINGKYLFFYNGNNYGETGFGFAWSKTWKY